MSLRPLLEIAAGDERFGALADAGRAGGPVEVHMSAAIRPYLLAALGVPVGPARLVTLCGLSVAKYLVLTGKEVGAEQALRWGIVHAVAPAPATEEQALNLAATVAEHSPEAVSRLKRMLHEWDGVEERSRSEGEGQVKWQHSGPGLPYRE